MEYEEALNMILREKVLKLEKALCEAEAKADRALQEKRRELQNHLSKVERENKLQIWTNEARIHNLEVKKKALQREVTKAKGEEVDLKMKVLLAEMDFSRSKINMAPLKRQVEKAKRRARECKNEASRSERIYNKIAEEFQILQQKQKMALEKLVSSKSEVAIDAMSELVEHEKEKNQNLKATLSDLKAKYEQLSNDEKPKQISQDQIKKIIEDELKVTKELQTYMDKLLQTVVEKCPELLEVIPNQSPYTKIFLNDGNILK